MAQTIRKVEGQAEIKCNADKFFDVWARNTPQVSNICPNVYSKIEVVDGYDCHTVGSVLSWTYFTPVDGRKNECVKTVLEDIDEKKKTFSFKVIEGEIMEKYYNSMRQKVEVIPKSENCCIVKWSITDYEKKCDDAPNPQVYVDFLLDNIKIAYCSAF